MIATITDYNKRVEAGRKVESQIFNALRILLPKHGIKIEEPTAEEDRRSKIDAWLTTSEGKRFSLQIKYRESGDDIIFEVVKDISDWTPGRDLISVADLYLVVDREKTGRLFRTGPIKREATRLLEIAKQDLTTSPNKVIWIGSGYELRLTTDHAHGNTKLMAFFHPSKFEVIQKWNNIITT